MKDGHTKLLGLQLEKSIRPKKGLWPLQSNSDFTYGLYMQAHTGKMMDGDGGFLLLSICHVHITGFSREFAGLKDVITSIRGGISRMHSLVLDQVPVCQNQFLRKRSLDATNATGPLAEEMTLIFARSIVNRSL